MTGPSINSNIANKINAIDARLAQLEAEQEQIIQEKNALLNQPISESLTSKFTPEQKVSLFRNLFKGRMDIFSTRWQNSKGRSGYSVARNNEWEKGVCNKPKIKCSNCSSREYKALNSQTIYDHLTGKQVVGLYPLLTDNTCYLLAADFDKEDWKNAVRAIAQVYLTFNIQHAVEISRSGNGAHLWVFFSEPVLARNTRSLGFGLLDKAMEIHPDLSFEPYDRLFPNLDKPQDKYLHEIIFCKTHRKSFLRY